MSEFKPRKGSYIKERNGQFFYRRAIPSAFRDQYDGKSEWNIRLSGRTASERVSEAHAYAHQHNREMEFGVESRVLTGFDESQTPDGPDLSVRLDFSKFPLPKGYVMPPFTAHRDGVLIETFKIALSRDPDFLRQAEKDGYFAMSYEEGEAQTELNKLMRRARDAENEDRKEIAELKADKLKSEIDDLDALRGETILSALPKWEKREKPRLTTQAAHKRRIQKFVDLHGNLPLASITKRHIIEFVEHLETLMHRGKPMVATTKSGYLASVAALLNFATSVDLIPFNPAHKVEPPKEHRPLIAQSWLAFNKAEVKLLITTATDLWARRRVLKFKDKLHLAC